MKPNTKNITTSALLCAMAYIVMLISKFIPEVAGFLQLDLKDVIIVTGGFVIGPVYALLISIVVSLIEMLTVSNTGPIGLLMNILSTAAFCYTASLIYSRKRCFSSAVISLVTGTIVLTAVMLLWNYYVTPIYMKVPREVVESMLLPVFLPFNLVKGFINSALTLILYRPIVKTLSRAGLVKSRTAQESPRQHSPAFVTGLVILAICIPIVLQLLGVF